MRRRLPLLALVGAAVTLAGALGPVQAAAPATFTKTTSRVLVSQPDELGQPVRLDADTYVPAGTAPAAGWPLVELFHGGGSDKDNGFDAGHAAVLADHGYGVILYSARGHGTSDGQTTVIGPKEIRDLFDVTNWALGRFPLDRGSIALGGYSQGGLHTNLAQVWATDPAMNPYGISFRALLPANTPDKVFDALVPGGVVKLSVGVGLIETYLVGAHAHVAPLIGKWIGATAADQTALYGLGPCALQPHDTETSSMRSDLAWRSVGCQPARMALPWHWAQSFDDEVFPTQMALDVWRDAPNQADHPLYLSMGGHTAPAADRAVEADKLDAQVQFLDHVFKGTPFAQPPVVYWTRDPRVAVPSSQYQYPSGAWFRQTASTWPPVGTQPTTWQLGADGRAVPSGASSGPLPLASAGSNESHDTVALAAMSATPLGTSPVPSSVPATDVPGVLARFRAPAFASDQDLNGSPVVNVSWMPAGPDTQLVLQVFDVAPGGQLTLLSRGVTGVRGAVPGQARAITVPGNVMSARIPAGHHLEAWVLAGDLAFYKPYPGSIGGVLQAGPSSTFTVPLRTPGP
jgi:predicted acyl esterase